MRKVRTKRKSKKLVRDVDVQQMQENNRKCKKCGSEHELQKHHDKDKHLPRTDKRKSKHHITLCRTCHEIEHHNEWIKLKNRAIEKRYRKKMEEIEKNWKTREKNGENG